MQLCQLFELWAIITLIQLTPEALRDVATLFAVELVNHVLAHAFGWNSRPPLAVSLDGS